MFESKIIRSLKWLSRQIGLTAIALVALSGARSAQADIIQRSFLNSSFEEPKFPDTCIYLIDEKYLAGWNTTHSLWNQVTFGFSGGVPCPLAGSNTDYGGAVPGHQIEIWRNNNIVGVNAPDGTQHAELNASESSALYQTMCLIQGEDIKFSFYHRGRDSATSPDVMQFNVGGTFSNGGSNGSGSFSGGTSVGTFSTTNNGTSNGTDPAQAVAGPNTSSLIGTPAGNGWVKYSGIFHYPGTSGNVNLQFGAISTPNNPASGNLLDNIQFYGKPVIELTASSSTGSALVVNPANPPKLRIVGQVDNQITVPVTVEVASSSAVQGSNFTPLATNSDFNIIIPPGNYDGTNNGIFPIPFQTTGSSNNNGKSIVFSIGSSTEYTRRSTTDCTVVTPIVQATYSMTSNANLLLVKRITAITDGVTGLKTSFDRPLTNLAECDDGKNPHDYDHPGWPSGYLVGKCNITQVKPGDELEYTIYFLNGGGANAKNVNICDRLNSNLIFQPQFETTTNNRGVAFNLQATTTNPPEYLTNSKDGDSGYFIEPNTPLTNNFISSCNLSGLNNSSGVVVVNAVTGSNEIVASVANGATPVANSYGYIKFKAKIRP
jgi:uncharacterized repeat protein (TIGR01451 family)